MKDLNDPEGTADLFKRVLFVEKIHSQGHTITIDELAAYINSQRNDAINEEIFQLLSRSFCSVKTVVKHEIKNALITSAKEGKKTIRI